MSFKSTKFAPDIYKALNGFLLVYKPPRLRTRELALEVKERITDNLNQYKQRSLTPILKILGDANEEKTIIQRHNLADSPNVAGPRYLPWELPVFPLRPKLEYRSSGLSILLIGSACAEFGRKFSMTKLPSVYHITGKFGYVTDNFWSDGRITDKNNYKYIKTGKLDSVLSKIQSSQFQRIFDATNTPLDSQEAYELAKSWPTRPARMANWPVIYSIRCIHLQVPNFKLEVTVINEHEEFLAQLCHDIGQMCKSSAFTESIRRIKFGPFHVDSSLTDKDLDLQSIINNLHYTSRISDAMREGQQQKLLEDYHSRVIVRREQLSTP